MGQDTTDTGVQVLEFRLGEGSYCVDIEYVAEIVDGGDTTSIPNSADYVEGVMDLRGRTTTIVNPCSILDAEDVNPDELAADGEASRNRIVILDPDTVDAGGTTGWLVSDVDEVTRVSDGEVEEDAVTDTDVLHGVVKKDDGFVLWVDPNELTG